MLRRAGLGLLVGALLAAPSVATAGPALVFEPINGTVFYSEDPDAQWFPGLADQADDRLCHLPGPEEGARSSLTPDHLHEECANPRRRASFGCRLAAQITVDTGLKSAHRPIGQRRRCHARRSRCRQHRGLRCAHE